MQQVGTRKISAMISLPVKSNKETRVSEQRDATTRPNHATAYSAFPQKAAMRSHNPAPWRALDFTGLRFGCGLELLESPGGSGFGPTGLTLIP